MKVKDLIVRLNQEHPETDVIVSIIIPKVVSRYGEKETMFFNEARDIDQVELTTEYYRCLQYNAPSISVLAIRVKQ